MSETRKANYEGVFFLTFTVVGWIDVFTRECYCDVLIKNLSFCQLNKSIDIFAYVIMPNHLHIIARRNNGLLSDWIRDYKSYTAKQLLNIVESNLHESRKEWMMYMFSYFAKASKQNKAFMFWQKTSHPTEIFTASTMQQKIDYIHNNPLRAGIVTNAAYYKYSSLNPDNGIEILQA
jgi:REP element-mobilizing transposase RayT